MPNESHPPAGALTPDPAPDAAGLLAARQSAVVADLPHCALLGIDGPDAAAFLQGQLSNDVTALVPEQCQYTSYNSPKGRMLANFVLWQPAPESFRALLPAELADGVATRLRRFVLRSKVTINDLGGETGFCGVGGPAAETVLRQTLGVAPAVFGVAEAEGATVLALPGPRYVVVAPVHKAGELRERLARLARPAGFPVWRWLTVDAGVPVITAADAGPVRRCRRPTGTCWAASASRKGCYPGQEIVARTRYLGRLKERLYVLHATAAAGPGDAPLRQRIRRPALRHRRQRRRRTRGGHDLLAVVQIAAAEARRRPARRAVDGPRARCAGAALRPARRRRHRAALDA